MKKVHKIGIIAGIIDIFIGIFTAVICFVFGRNKGFIEGYRDADIMMKNESFKSF